MTKASKKTEETMTAQEVCELLQVSMPTLYRRVASGEVPAVPKPVMLKRRNRLEFYRSEIEALLKRD